MRSKILKTIGIFFTILILLLVAISIFLQTDYSREFIKNVAEKTVTAATRQTFTIGKVEIDFIRGIRLMDVCFKIEKEKFISIEEASIQYSLPLILNSSMLFARVIPINNIVLKGVNVNLIQEKDGNWNFSKIGEKKEEKEDKEEQNKEHPGWSIILRNFLLQDAYITSENRKKNEIVQAEIPELIFSLKMFNVTKKIELDLKKAVLNISPQEIKVGGLSTKAVYTGDKASIKNLSLNLNGAEIKLDGEIENFEEPGFKFKASAYGYELRDIGVLNAEIEGSGKYKSPEDIEAEVTVKMPYSQLMGKKVEAAISSIKIQGTNLEISSGVVRTDFGETSFSGDASLRRMLNQEGANDFNFHVLLRDIKTTEIFALIEKQSKEKHRIINPDLDAKLNADLKIDGTWKEIDDLEALIKLDKFLVTGNKAGELDLKGLVEAKRSNLKFDINSNFINFNLASILGNNKYSSDITSDLKLKGSLPLTGDLLDNLTASVDGKVLPSTVFDVKLSGATINASYAQDTLDIKSFSLISDTFKLKAEGAGKREKGLNFNYDLDVSDLSLISKFAPELALKGSLKAEGNVKGTIKKPEIDLTANLTQFGYKEDLEIKSIVLNGQGSADFENPDFRAEGKLSGLKIGDKNIESARLEVRSLGKGLSGVVSIKEDDQRAYNLELKIADLTSEEKKLEVSKLKLDLENGALENKNSIGMTISPGKLTVESFNLHHKNSSAIGDANVNFDGNIDVDLKLTDFNLADVSNLIQLEPPLQGITSATINVQGKLEEPRIEARLTAQNLSYLKFESDKARLDLSYSNRRLELDLSVNENGGEMLVANGRADLDLNFKKIGENLSSANFDITAKSSGLELSPVAALSDEIQKIDGQLILDSRLSGNLKSPRLVGKAQLREASLKIESLRNEMKIENALVEMQGRKGFLRNLEIKTDGGKGNFTGEFDLSDLSYNFSGKMNNLQIEPKAVSARVDGSLDVKGSGGKIDIGGNLKVQRARITIPEKPEKKIEEIKFVDQDEPEEFVIEEKEETDFFKDNVAMDLSVNIPRNAWVKGKGANVELRGDVKVDKKHSGPLIVTGNVNTVRGTYQIFGKLFRIEEGRVSFPGTPEIDPLLDITALYKVSNVDVFVNINGKVSQPKIELTSNPPMEETDIISYLVFGTSSDKLGTGERSSLDQVAAGVAGGIAARELKNLVGEQFSLDVITIGGGENGPQIELGKYLTDDLYIGYQRTSTQSSTTTPSATNNVSVEYRLFDFLTLESELGGEQAGADIFFNFNY